MYRRIVLMLQNVLLQKKVSRVVWPGLLHGLFFWGFGLLVIGTTLIVIQADFTDLFFNVKFLTGSFYKLFSIVLDIAGTVCLFMLGGLLVRRGQRGRFSHDGACALAAGRLPGHSFLSNL